MNVLLALKMEIVQVVVTIIMVALIIAIFFYERSKRKKYKNNEISKTTMLINYIVYFIIIVLGAIVIVTIWEPNALKYLAAYINRGLKFLGKSLELIILSILVLFIFSFLSKLITLLLSRVGSKVGVNQKRRQTVTKLVSSVIRYTLVIIMIIVILAMWGVNVIPALAGLGILGLVLGLGAQQFINDLISGFFIIFEQHFDVGDIVEVDGFKGTVSDLGLKTTRVLNAKGQLKIISNGKISSLINYSKNHSVAMVDFTIAYKEDISKVTLILNDNLDKKVEHLDQVLTKPSVVGVIGLNENGVELRVSCKTLTEQHYTVERTLRQAIKELLEQNNIEIPFKQVVIHQVKGEK